MIDVQTFISEVRGALYVMNDRALERDITAAGDAVTAVLREGGAVHVTGVGKSGIAARKIADTFAAHGLAGHYLDPVTALHGDIGRVQQGDALIAVSASGTTTELARLAATRGPQAFLVGIYGVHRAQLAPCTAFPVNVRVTAEDDELTRFVPSMSFVAACLAGDALALHVAYALDAPGVALTHPGGHLGTLT